MIRTFIFFDLETTGLIKNNAMPRITEMSLIAVSESSIRSGMDSLPRVLHKLTLPIHPNINLTEKIEAITGLTNESLTEAQSFNCEIYTLVTNFIKLLKAPTCFVAHNGNNFDYPIFLWELQNINKVLSKDILCIDMLPLVRDFFLQQENPIRQMNNAQSINRTSRNNDDINMLNDGYDAILSDALDSAMNSSLNSCDKNETAAHEHHNPRVNSQQSCYKSMQAANEKTPESQKVSESRYRNAMFRNMEEESPSRKKLDFTSGKPANLKLSTIYKHLFHKCPENVHSAEGDCLNMIQCAIKFGDFFLEWAKHKAVPLISHTK